MSVKFPKNFTYDNSNISFGDFDCEENKNIEEVNNSLIIDKTIYYMFLTNSELLIFHDVLIYYFNNKDQFNYLINNIKNSNIFIDINDEVLKYIKIFIGVLFDKKYSNYELQYKFLQYIKTKSISNHFLNSINGLLVLYEFMLLINLKSQDILNENKNKFNFDNETIINDFILITGIPQKIVNVSYYIKLLKIIVDKYPFIYDLNKIK